MENKIYKINGEAVDSNGRMANERVPYKSKTSSYTVALVLTVFGLVFQIVVAVVF